ncbi:MAG: hypothetical protein EZS28_047359 [Streblomastix strix]|uniref:Uncharacterized protein n=1 Tax=Streblomastix strix TaxID=222440 RepID=A0A5J4TI09_9EUKA|nr:MAG: hypothetical protein EZS28_047359 [Streblomastix strix]
MPAVSIIPQNDKDQNVGKGLSCHFVMDEQRLKEMTRNDQLRIIIVNARNIKEAEILALTKFPAKIINQSRPDWVVVCRNLFDIFGKKVGEITFSARMVWFGDKFTTEFDSIDQSIPSSQIPPIPNLQTKKCSCGVQFDHICSDYLDKISSVPSSEDNR